MTDQTKKSMELIEQLVQENDNTLDFMLDLQAHPQIQNDPDAFHLALQTWKETHPEELRTAA